MCYFVVNFIVNDLQAMVNVCARNMAMEKMNACRLGVASSTMERWGFANIITIINANIVTIIKAHHKHRKWLGAALTNQY